MPYIINYNLINFTACFTSIEMQNIVTKEEGSSLIIFLALLDTQEQITQFEEIYNANRKTMLTKAEGVLGSSGWAEDAVHEAFLRIAKNIEKFTPLPCHEIRYLCVTIVRNVSLNMRRDSHMADMVSLDNRTELSESSDIADELLRVERMTDLERSLENLDLIYKDVVHMRLVLEFSTRETAELLGLSEDVVRARLHRGREKLKKLLIEGGVAHV